MLRRKKYQAARCIPSSKIAEVDNQEKDRFSVVGRNNINIDVEMIWSLP
jgi:hypothetical protein